MLPSRDGLDAYGVYAEDAQGEPVTTETAAEYADYYELTYPILADTDGAAFDEWSFGAGRPRVFVLDEAGLIRWRGNAGDNDVAQMTETIDRLLGE